MNLQDELQHRNLHVSINGRESLDWLLDFMKNNAFSYPEGEKQRQFAIILIKALLSQAGQDGYPTKIENGEISHE